LGDPTEVSRFKFNLGDDRKAAACGRGMVRKVELHRDKIEGESSRRQSRRRAFIQTKHGNNEAGTQKMDLWR
jgi:hypothetical protein